MTRSAFVTKTLNISSKSTLLFRDHDRTTERTRNYQVFLNANENKSEQADDKTEETVFKVPSTSDV